MSLLVAASSKSSPSLIESQSQPSQQYGTL